MKSMTLAMEFKNCFELLSFDTESKSQLRNKVGQAEINMLYYSVNSLLEKKGRPIKVGLYICDCDVEPISKV